MSDLFWSFNKGYNPYSYLPQLVGWGNLKFYGRNFANSLLDCVIVNNFYFVFEIQKVKLRGNNYFGFI